MSADPLFFDNSMMSSVVCSTEATLRYVHHRTTRDEKAYLLAGTGGHEAMAVWFVRQQSRSDASL